MTRARVENANQFGVSQVGGDALLERLRLHRLEQARLVGDLEARRVDGDQHVGGAARAFVLDPLESSSSRPSIRLIWMPVSFVKLA